MYKKRTRRLKRRNRRRVRQSKKRVYRGGNTEKVLCCMCEKQVLMSDTLVPSICFRKNMDRAHRICKECWWKKDTGFASEHGEHRCPGCEKGLPLLPKKEYGVIDIDD